MKPKSIKAWAVINPVLGEYHVYGGRVPWCYEIYDKKSAAQKEAGRRKWTVDVIPVLISPIIKPKKK
jgi:hypothetical protein